MIETTYLLDEFDDLEDGLSAACMTEAGLCIATALFGISMAVKPKLRPPPLCKSTVSPELLTSNCSVASDDWIFSRGCWDWCWDWDFMCFLTAAEKKFVLIHKYTTSGTLYPKLVLIIFLIQPIPFERGLTWGWWNTSSADIWPPSGSEFWSKCLTSLCSSNDHLVVSFF